MSEVKRHKKKDSSKYITYIRKLLKSLRPEIGLTASSQTILDDMVQSLLCCLCCTAKDLALMSKKKTLGLVDVQSAVRLIVPGDFGKKCYEKGQAAITRYNSAGSSKYRSRQTKSSQAGLIFPVSRVGKYLKEHTGLRIGSGAPVFLAAVLECIMRDILEGASNAAVDYKKARITPRFIMFSIKGYEELDYLFKNYVILKGGVVPYIRKQLLPKKK